MNKSKTILSIVILLGICFSLSGQPYEVKSFFSNLNKNISSSGIPDDVIMQYCKTKQPNINTLFYKNNKVSIGDESYVLNERAEQYYTNLQNLSYTDKCKLLFAWAEIRGCIYELIDDKNLPREIAYLPIALTALDDNYQGTAGAFGVWGLQYIPALKYGIVADSCYEQRLDLHLNTKAATSYIVDLYENFRTWDYTITAYSCGAPNLIKAGYRTTSFDSVYNNISSLEKDCFYRLLAITRWMQENETSDFGLPPHNLISISDTIIINSRVHFDQIANVLNINATELKNLNPLFIGNIIDGKRIPKVIYLPSDYKTNYYILKDSIHAYLDSVYFPKYTPPVNTGNKYESYVHVSVSPGDGYEEIKYTIVSGDNLGSIAEKYNIKLVDLKDWNNISGTNIYAGQKISIWVKEGTQAAIIKIEKKKTVEVKKEEKNTVENHFSMKDYKFIETYEVKSGDSPYKIASNYTWATSEDIMAWNNISDPSKLKIGQKLKIFKKR